LPDADQELQHAIGLFRVVATIVVPQDLTIGRVDDYGFHRGRAYVESNDDWSVHLTSKRRKNSVRQHGLSRHCALVTLRQEARRAHAHIDVSCLQSSAFDGDARTKSGQTGVD
jgi:hypothetical protein